MDDRKKRIDDLLKNTQETRVSLDTLLESFGEKLYSRTKEAMLQYEGSTNFDDISQYNEYLKDIAESDITIGKIEEKSRRFKELEEAIHSKEQEEKDRAREMAGVYRRLGKALLHNPHYEDFTLLFKEQAEALKAKLESLEARIGELDNKEGGNVFTWIGKSAQGLVLKSFLSKAQENQEQLYHTIGERFNDRVLVIEDDDVAMIRAEIDVLRDFSRAAQDEIAVLKDEKRIISASFGMDGNPQKQIQSIKSHIVQINEDLTKLYKTFGAQASGIMDENVNPDRKYFIDTIVTAEDGETIGRAVRLTQALDDNEKAVSKLRASLSIDEEKAKIEKYKRSIEDKQKRIAEFEASIKDLEESVSDCEDYIKDLEKQL